MLVIKFVRTPPANFSGTLDLEPQLGDIEGVCEHTCSPSCHHAAKHRPEEADILRVSSLTPLITLLADLR